MDDPVFYISGPMTGKPNYNYDAFNACAEALRSMGYQVVNPAEHFDGRQDLPRHKFLAADVQALIEKCNAIVFLPRWTESDGALLEAQIAVDRDYACYMWWSSGELCPVGRYVVEMFL